MFLDFLPQWGERPVQRCAEVYHTAALQSPKPSLPAAPGRHRRTG